MNEGQGSPDAPVILKPATAVQQKDNPFTHDPRSSFVPDTAHEPAPDMLNATPLPALNLKNDENAGNYRAAFGLPAEASPIKSVAPIEDPRQLVERIEEARETVQDAGMKSKLDAALMQLPAEDQVAPDENSDKPHEQDPEEKKGIFNKIKNWLIAFLAAIGIPVGLGTKKAFEAEMSPTPQGGQ